MNRAYHVFEPTKRAEPIIFWACVLLTVPAVLSAESTLKSLRMNKYYIAGPQAGEDRQLWLERLRVHRQRVRSGDVPLDRSIYDRGDLGWAAKAYSCHFTFMFDRSLYDPDKGEYTLDAFLDEGIREFGGYDMILLWQGYPRLGVDERNQFDFYRDMPGGLAGLRDLVRRAYERGVKVSIDYNPWDVGTRRAGKSDEQALAELVQAIEADAVFLDTMPVGSSVLREAIDKVRPGVVFVPEIYPPVTQLAMCSASWAQGLEKPDPPCLLRLKWIEPRHMQYQIRRWDPSHTGEIESAFFNGSGMLIWENIFGTYNPWIIQDRRIWRQAVGILRHFADNFTSDAWDPFYPTFADALFAHRWPGDKATLYTLLNLGQPIQDGPLLQVSHNSSGLVYYDLWSGRPLTTKPNGRYVSLIGSIDRLGCILAINKSDVDPSLKELLDCQRQLAGQHIPKVDGRNHARSVIEPEPVKRTKPVSADQDLPGMAFVPGGKFRMTIRHRARECGCYPDPGTPEEKWAESLFGWQMKGLHDYEVEVNPFFIDAAEVSNAQFKQFLESSGYRPEHAENFLKHWPNGKMPSELAEHPVVYVDIDDARAYAKWAGKRLPTEPEWHLAAQGTDGRIWPWGNEFDPNKCNTTGDRTLPVHSCPEGRSPYGCYHMAGNVWEWTESCRDDGHTRFIIIRGGSYFNAEGSDWYVQGGPKPCNHHTKFIRMWPGLDRCSTIGFRCVVDVEPQ